jgi:hypothetical protein
MSAFYQIITSHDAVVVNAKSYGELGNLATRIDAPGDLYAPVAAIAVPSMPSHVFLVGAEHPVPLRIALSDLASHTLALRLQPSPEPDQVALSHPVMSQFLSAIIPDERSGYARIEGNRREVYGWESFRLQPLESADITDRLQLIAERIDLLFSCGISVDSIVDMIRADQVGGTPEVLDAALPFLATFRLEALAARLLHDEALCEKLAVQLPNDPWAVDGIPALRQWLAQRDENGSTVPAAHYECPKAQTVLGIVGLHGDAGSLAHACLHAMRRSVIPTRGPAILACVRNEGIYLLEWIAYHRALGIEWFFLYSNDNDDRSDGVLRTLAEQGIITWIDNPLEPGAAAQHKAYGHALGIVPDILDFTWVQVLDGDEFIVLSPEHFSNIDDYLRWTETRPVDVISLNWRFLASEPLADGEETLFREPLTLRNTNFVRYDVIGDAGSRLVKSMFRPAQVIQSQAHHPLASSRYAITMCLADGSPHQWRSPPGGMPASAGFADHVIFENIGIYHYFYKSPEEWMWKSSRNRGDNPSKSGLDLRSFVDGWIGNFMSQIHGDMRSGQDHWLASQRDRLIAELETLKGLPGMAEALHDVYATYRERAALIRERLREENTRDQLSDHNKPFFDLIGVP